MLFSKVINSELKNGAKLKRIHLPLTSCKAMYVIELFKKGILFDSHCHLNDSSFDKDRDDVVKRAKNAGVEHIIDIGIDVESSKKAVANSKKYTSLFASVGVDPENIIPGSDLFHKELFDLSDGEFAKKLESLRKELGELAKNEKVLLIGETGIDNYWLTKSVESGDIDSEDQRKSLQMQEMLFRMHCQLSKKSQKPLTIHSRNAIDDCLEILTEEDIPARMAIFHSLTPDIGDNEEKFYKKSGQILEKGYLIGVNGIITFKNAEMIRNVYRKFFELGDLEKMYKAGFVFETDAPFLSPEPKRGERNEPGNLVYILEQIH